jgi:CRP-like cAMP-binding protein/membrane protease YdiL (CAAX protease family)
MEKLAFLQKSELFKDVSHAQLLKIASLVKEFEVNAGETIIEENEICDMIYLVKDGQVKVSKFDHETNQTLSLSILDEGAILGEVSLLDNQPRSATIAALTDCQLYGFSSYQMEVLSQEDYYSFSKRLQNLVNFSGSRQVSIYSNLIKNLAKSVGQRIRTTNDSVVQGLKEQLISNKARLATGRLIINTLTFLCLYMWLIEISINFRDKLPSSSYISIPIITIFGFAVLVMMRQSGYPLSIYGLTFKHWKISLFEATIASVCMAVLIILYKIFIIHHNPAFTAQPIFNLDFNAHVPISIIMGLGLIVSYLVFVPLQELIVRGALQSSFCEFLIGKYKVFWSIVLSNLFFSITHLHLSLAASGVVMVPGLIWGWLYSRYRTLVGVTASHLFIGVWALFVVGIF